MRSTKYDSLPQTKGALRQLPTSNTTDNGSFYALLAPYGIATGINSGTVESADGQYNIAKAPLYFVRSGFYGLGYGGLRHTGLSNYLWSSRAASVGRAYSLATTSSSSDYGQDLAFPLRCLARQ